MKGCRGNKGVMFSTPLVSIDFGQSCNACLLRSSNRERQRRERTYLQALLVLEFPPMEVVRVGEMQKLFFNL